MKCPLSRMLLTCAALVCVSGSALAYPKPNPFPRSWELKFNHGLPRRILVTPPGSATPQAFWYLMYTVTNTTSDEQKFLPVFELLSETGKLQRSDQDIPAAALQAIRLRERNKHLLSLTEIAGPLRIGEDQAKDGVAIWREPMAEMGQFSIFVTGLCGESLMLKDDKGNLIKRQVKIDDQTIDEIVVLWKTLHLRYKMEGDAAYPGHDPYQFIDQEWIMRCPDYVENAKTPEDMKSIRTAPSALPKDAPKPEAPAPATPAPATPAQPETPATPPATQPADLNK